MSTFEQRYKVEIENFGKRLKELRKNKSLTQLDIEVATGINRTEISKIENGLKNIEFITIVRLAITLDVSITDLFSDKS